MSQTNAAAVAAVLLPHDWLTWRLGAARAGHGPRRRVGHRLLLHAPATGCPVPAPALGRRAVLPRVAAPGRDGRTDAGGARCPPGTGDNMAAALGLGLEPGEIASRSDVRDRLRCVGRSGRGRVGGVAGFADATGQFLPLACNVNATRSCRPRRP